MFCKIKRELSKRKLRLKKMLVERGRLHYANQKKMYLGLACTGEKIGNQFEQDIHRSPKMCTIQSLGTRILPVRCISNYHSDTIYYCPIISFYLLSVLSCNDTSIPSNSLKSWASYLETREIDLKFYHLYSVVARLPSRLPRLDSRLARFCQITMIRG